MNLLPFDCDDEDRLVGQSAPEACNGIDDDCDGVIDGPDADGDGVTNACDNCVYQANPGQADLDQDGLGDACDPCTDRDGDGYGNPGHGACPAGGAVDRADLDPFTSPAAPEVDDGRDNDCDGMTDEGLDDDGDGMPNFRDRCRNTFPGLPVTPDGCLSRGRALTSPAPS